MTAPGDPSGFPILGVRLCVKSIRRRFEMWLGAGRKPWNRHDMAGMATLLTADADFRERRGSALEGAPRNRTRACAASSGAFQGERLDHPRYRHPVFDGRSGTRPMLRGRLRSSEAPTARHARQEMEYSRGSWPKMLLGGESEPRTIRTSWSPEFIRHSGDRTSRTTRRLAPPPNITLQRTKARVCSPRPLSVRVMRIKHG